jgi:hypothetical protein
LDLGSGPKGAKVSNQKALASAIEEMTRQKALKKRMLNNAQFPCGKIYFEQGGRMFSDDANCSECVIVHNNWIVTKAGKIYRFKETGFWHVDADGYYSDPTRKYLTYENTADFGTLLTLKQETQALQAALFIGYLLNRTVILPAFHCNGCITGACGNAKNHCALNQFFYVQDFDAQFAGAYRERVFLRHPAVPESVRSSQSDVLLIESKEWKQLRLSNEGQGMLVFTPGNSTSIQSKAREIVEWFKGFGSYSVLRFHSLYGLDFIDSKESDSKELKTIRKKLRVAFIPTEYMQPGRYYKPSSTKSLLVDRRSMLPKVASKRKSSTFPTRS